MAQVSLSRVGDVKIASQPTNAAISPVKGNDGSYDPANNVFLTVGTCYNAPGCPAGMGEVYGLFSNPDGTAAGPAFTIDGAGDGNFPRARYSPHINGGLGGFLVVWSEEPSGHANLIRTRVVSYSAGTGVVVGPQNTINGPGSYSWIESGPAIAYSMTSQRFLVAWKTYPPGAYLASRLVGIDGAPAKNSGVELPVVQLSAGFGRDPGVAWDSNADRFGVSFGAETASGTVGFAVFASVSPFDSSFIRESFSSILGLVFITDLEFNPDTQRFVMTWHQKPVGTQEVRVAEVSATASLVTIVTEGLITRLWPAYDALSLARNPASRTFTMISLASTPVANDDDISGVELNERGSRTGDLTVLAPDVTGRYPRITASSSAPLWSVSFSDGYQTLKTFVATTSSTNGGPSGSYPSPGTAPTPAPTPTPTPTPTPGACTTTQPGPTWTCVNGDWKPPADPTSTPTVTVTPTPTPTPSSCTTPQPDATWTCYNGDWLPPGMGPAPTSTPTPTSATCTTPQPGATWTCYNGDWLPPGMAPPTGTPTPTATPNPVSCTTPQPGATWSCYNGDWLPPGMYAAHAAPDVIADANLDTRFVHDDATGPDVGLCERKLDPAGPVMSDDRAGTGLDLLQRELAAAVRERAERTARAGE